MRKKTRPALPQASIAILLGIWLGGSAANAATAPTFDPAPADAVISKGNDPGFTFVVNGDPVPILQWYRDGKALPGFTSTTMGLVATMTDSGSYTLLARNIVGAKTSPAVKLAVVDTDTAEVPVVVGHTARIAAPTLATGVTFHWQKDGAEITPSSRITGINARELVITKTEAGDAGEYTCNVTLGTASLTSGARSLVPVLGKPVIVQPIYVGPYAPAVASYYTLDVEAEYYPDSFAISGLPDGLVLNQKTGTVTGVPRESGTFHLKITATNALGTSDPVYFDLTIEPLPPSSLGSLVGVWPADDATNNGLGGRCSITMNKNGAFTATAVLGAHSYSVSGMLGTDSWAPGVPQDTITLARPGGTPLYLTVSQDVSTGINCGVTDQSPNIGGYTTCQCRRLLARTSSTGRYTFTTSDSSFLSGVPNLGWFTLGSTGSLSGAIRLLDGQAVTLGTRLTTEYWAPVHTVLYGSTGSLSGTISIDGYDYPPEITGVAGSLHWMKKPQAKFTRNLRDGFSAYLVPVGYGWPSGEMAAYARQRYGGLNWASVSTAFTVSGGTGTLPKIYTDANSLGWKTFSISGSTGFWSGSGTNRYLPDPYDNPKQHIDRGFYALGLMVRDSNGNISCPGHLRMVDLPDDSLGTTLSNSPLSFYNASYSASSFSTGSISVVGGSSSGGTSSGGLIITGAVLTTSGH